MRRVLFIVLLFAATSSFAQVQEYSVPLASQAQGPRVFTAEQGDTLDLPFTDDFSYPSTRPTPALWADSHTWVNTSMAIASRSVGVAKFDGLDSLGFAYAPGANNSDTFADILTSRYINLENANNVYLTFQYQEGGRGELPSEDDSLVVLLWSPIDSAWSQTWGAKGHSTSTSFRSAVVPVIGPAYMQKGFRFRIAAYGARSGAFDIWNINYVQLDKDRNPADTVITEPAFAAAHPPLIGNKLYTSWPWWLSSASNLSNFPSQLTFTYRRNGDIPPGGWSLNLGRYLWKENGTTVAQLTAVPVVTNTNHDQDLTFDVQVPSTAFNGISGPLTVDTKVWFDGSAAGTRQNDTVRGRLVLDNYLALENGTAERAYAVQNINGGRVAQKFRVDGLGNTDSLKGVYFQFVDAGPRYSSTFRLAIWAPADSGSGPGNLIYRTDSLYEPHWGYERGDLMPYELDTTLSLAGYTFVYIGYICTSSAPLMVGLDQQRDLPSALPRYYGDGFNWYQSLEAGALVMRPYFNYSPANLSSQPPGLEASKTLQIYPNPAGHQVRLDGLEDRVATAQIFHSSGALVMEVAPSLPEVIDISELPEGTYILVVRSSGGVQYAKFTKTAW